MSKFKIGDYVCFKEPVVIGYAGVNRHSEKLYSPGDMVRITGSRNSVVQIWVDDAMIHIDLHEDTFEHSDIYDTPLYRIMAEE